jgi:hypothetical protein
MRYKMQPYKKRYTHIEIVTYLAANMMSVWGEKLEKCGGDEFESYGRAWNAYMVDGHVVLISPFTHKPEHVFSEMESFRHFLHDLADSVGESVDDKKWYEIRYGNNVIK